jgi:anti-sigma factor RsiW
MVQAYADGQLDVADALEVERHLKECARCTAADRNQRVLSAAIKDPALVLQSAGRVARTAGRDSKP